MRSRVTPHQQTIVLEQAVGVLEHEAVHLGEQLQYLDERDVHHARLVEHRRTVLYTHRHTHTQSPSARFVVDLLRIVLREEVNDKCARQIHPSANPFYRTSCTTNPQ